MPPARTEVMRAFQTSRSIRADVQANTSADTRLGAASAKVMATIPPSDKPQTAAWATPAASRTEAASSAS